MASRTQARLIQNDFSGGAVTATAPELIPENAVRAIRNGFVGPQDGSIFRRGGAEYVSDEAFGTRGTFLFTGRFDAGVRTVFASPENFGVLDSDDESPIDLGGAGMNYPQPAAFVDGYLFLPGGYIYAGSRKAASYSTGTVDVTAGSTTVEGTGTAFLANVDAGMLLQIGDERVYRVDSITDDDTLELAEPYEGSTDTTVSYTLSPLYAMDADDPYPIASIYAVAQNRLLWAEGRFLRFSPLNHDEDSPRRGFPMNHAAHEESDEWPFPEDVLGIAEVQGNTIVFTRAGTYVVSAIGFDIVDFDGNPQQRLTKLSEHVLVEGAGLAYWQQGLVAPLTDGVYLIDGVSQPQKLSDNIDPDYHEYVRRGYRTGQAAVHRSHFFLPFLTDAGTVKRVYSLLLDRRAFDKRRRLTFPWTWHDGDGADVSAFVADLADDRKPRLLAIQSNATARILDCSAFLRPDAAHAADPSEEAHELEVITRDFATGNDTDNRVRRFVTRYELTGDGELHFFESDGSYDSGGAKWGQAQWGNAKWGSVGAGFRSLACPGGESDGRDTHPCRVNKRRRFVRGRLRSSGACATLVIRSFGVVVFPSKAVRR